MMSHTPETMIHDHCLYHFIGVHTVCSMFIDQHGELLDIKWEEFEIWMRDVDGLYFFDPFNMKVWHATVDKVTHFESFRPCITPTPKLEIPDDGPVAGLCN